MHIGEPSLGAGQCADSGYGKGAKGISQQSSGHLAGEWKQLPSTDDF